MYVGVGLKFNFFILIDKEVWEVGNGWGKNKIR